jgi:hypothetical protein
VSVNIGVGDCVEEKEEEEAESQFILNVTVSKWKGTKSFGEISNLNFEI